MPGEKCAGDPCNAGTGNEFQDITDYSTSGQNPLAFTRYYNSLATTDPYAKELGSNWRHTYDRYLNVGSSTVTAYRADGQQLIFTNNNGAWSTDSDIDVSLTNSGLSWTLTDHNDTVETYTQTMSGEAQLQTIVARNGYTQTMAYTGGQLASVTDSYGRKLGFTYNSSGQLTQVTTPDSLVLSYGYNAGELASVTYNTNPVTQQLYSYVNTTDLASITDENGNVYASWTYDGQHRATSSQHADGAEAVNITYYDDGSRLVVNALGQKTAYNFTTLQNVPKITKIARAASATVPAAAETFTYDSNGYTASKTDWNGNTTAYVNDVHGQPTSITEAAGTPQERTMAITYVGTLPGKIVAPRETVDYTYDAYGNPLTRTETDTSGGATNGQTRTWTYTYDTTGHVLTATNPLGAVTTYTYNGNNIATVTDALGHVSKVTSYTGGGLPLSITDPNGVTTTLTYDTRNRLTSRTTAGATTQFAYDGAGNLTTLTMPDRSQLFYTYDAARRVTGVRNSAGENIAYTYDANDDIAQQQVAGSTITKTQSAVFDSLGRMLRQIGAYNETTAFAYDANGNRIGTTDALNNSTSQSFDALNRLVRSVDPLHNATTDAYDAQDNLTSVTGPRGITTAYTYDGFGQVLSERSPDSGTTIYTLDAMGNRVQQKDARGVITNRTFDKLNRVLTEAYPAAPREKVTYYYDRGQYGIGRLSAISDESGSTVFGYNARGDVLTDTRTIGGRSYTTSYDYNLADHITSITYPDRRTIDYTRDSVGRISAITEQRRPIISRITYKPFGPVSGFTFGNGVAETLAYDEDYRLTGILAKGSTTIQNLTMAYDPVNDITSITDNSTPIPHGHDHDHDGDRDRGHGFGIGHDDDRAANLSQSFTYDADYRLLSAASGFYGAEAFTYDANGNRLSKTDITTDPKGNKKTIVKSYTYDTASNRLLGLNDNGNPGSFTYDAAGNLLTAPGQSFSYNARNRSSAIETQGWKHEHWGHNRDGDHDSDHDSDDNARGGASYTYNALGERVSKATNGRDRLFNDSGNAHFIYDQQGNLIAETDGFGRIAKDYVYLNGLPVAMIEGDDVRYISTDNLGTPQKVTDEGQQVVWSRASEPFGETADIKGGTTLNLRFQGQYHDAESDLDQNGFRSYNPKTGRYTQTDPAGLFGGINRFTYVGGNPVNRIDPLGLMANEFPGAVSCLTEGECIATGGGLAGGPVDAPIEPTTQTEGGEPIQQLPNLGTPSGGQCSSPSMPVGSKSSPINVPGPQNTPGTVGNLNYTGHAFDQMQGRGITPSVVEDTIKNGIPSSGYNGATIYTTDQARVIVNPNGTIKTVYPQ